MIGSIAATLPTFTPVEKVGERSLTQRYLLTDTTKQNRHGEDETAALDITVSHNKDYKRYTVRFYRITISGRIESWAMELRSEDPQPVKDYVVEYAQRYSAKRLREIFDTVVGGMEASGSPLGELLDWASRAHRR
jgi:hypothetical protein